MRILSFVLILISLGLLLPGVLFPVLTIDASITLPLLGKMNLGSETRSVWGTITFLYEQKNYLVAGLIFLFSVIIPSLKNLLLFYVLLPGQGGGKRGIFAFIKRIGKWSMADVFVVAVFLAFLSTKSMQGFSASLEKGFYYFLGYCLLSLIATEFILFVSPKELKK